MICKLLPIMFNRIAYRSVWQARRITWLLFACLVHSLGLYASPADSLLNYDVSAAQFRINDTLSLAEIYFGLQRDALAFVQRDSVLEAGFEITVRVLRDGRQLAKESWRSSTIARTQDEINDTQRLFSLTRFQMKAGHYRIETHVQDLHADRWGEQDFGLEIKPFAGGALQISDIELAAALRRDDQPGRFYKNGYQVIPNPGALYGDGLPLLMFYAEIYNLQPTPQATYTVSYRIRDADGEVIKSFPEKQKPIAGASLVEAGGFNVISLPSGSYTFELEIYDAGAGHRATRRERFFVFRNRDQLATRQRSALQSGAQLLVYEYQQKTEKELDEEFEAARYVASQEEIAIYQGLDLDGKRNFLVRFWSSRDSDTTTVVNEFREDYLKRVQFAAQNFGGFKAGWLTDRGRVLLLYGMPDEIESFPSSNDVRAYQIWNYFDIEGGVKFYFVDIRGWGDYEQVHSTARNELADPDWERWLRPSR